VRKRLRKTYLWEKKTTTRARACLKKMASRVPDEEVTPEVQAWWALSNDLRLARDAALKDGAHARYELARAAALERAVEFAQEAARLSREAVRAQDAELALDAAIRSAKNATRDAGGCGWH
jgi:hypothetical protein